MMKGYPPRWEEVASVNWFMDRMWAIFGRMTNLQILAQSQSKTIGMKSMDLAIRLKNALLRTAGTGILVHPMPKIGNKRKFLLKLRPQLPTLVKGRIVGGEIFVSPPLLQRVNARRGALPKNPDRLKSMTEGKKSHNKFLVGMIKEVWKDTCQTFPDVSSDMIDAFPKEFWLENTGFTKLTFAINNPTPLQYDNNNFGRTHLVMYNVNENLHASYDRNDHHVLGGHDFMGCMLINKDHGETVIIGDYRRILHGNWANFPSKTDRCDKEKKRNHHLLVQQNLGRWSKLMEDS